MMSITKRLWSCLLVLVLLIPAISFHDDAISLAAFRSNDIRSDDTISAVGPFQNSDYDSILATLLDRLEILQVGSKCTLYIDVSSTPIHLTEIVDGCNRSVSAPVGRAPPSA
jgi:hypothetical protein